MAVFKLKITESKAEQYFTLAPKRVWFLSHLIDLLLLQVVQLAGAYMGGVFATLILSYRAAPADVLSEGAAAGMFLGWVFWGLVGAILNYGVLQGMTGCTVAKAACGIQVVSFLGKTVVVDRRVMKRPEPHKNSEDKAA
jgi:hypothetical protein